MLLGINTFAEAPFSATNLDLGNVQVVVTGNQLTINIGNVSISATSIIEFVNGDDLDLTVGTVTITGDASFALTGNPLTIGNGNVTVTAGATADVTGNPQTLTTGTVLITGTTVVNPTGTPITLASGTINAIVWENIIPDADGVWTNIDTEI